MTDITVQKQAERNLAAKEAQLHVALDNMPGALVYTDEDLNIVVCNDRFKEMYRAPMELLQAGRPYPHFLRFLAENGYYGEGDVDTMVARRVESLRDPSGKASRKIIVPTFSATLTTTAFHRSSSRWLGISGLIAEPEGPSCISSTVAHCRLDRRCS